MTTMELRRAEPEDARAIAGLHARSWRAGYGDLLTPEALEPLPDDERERRWRRTLAGAEPAMLVLVAAERGEIAGFCAVAMPSRDRDADRETGEIAAIYVDPGRWRSGIGSRLAAAALGGLGARGYREATLWAFAANAGARAFYRLAGFEPDGRAGEWRGAATVRLRAWVWGMMLRPLAPGDEAALRSIRSAPEVRRWWGPPEEGFPWTDEPEATRRVIEVDGELAGLVQHHEEAEPRYRHASVDLFLAPAFHGRGLGTEAVRRVASHLIRDRGHHRVTIDPAAANRAAIRAYEKAGFRPVGLMRRYERDADGDGWHDGLLMDLLAGEEAGREEISPRAPRSAGRDPRR